MKKIFTLAGGMVVLLVLVYVFFHSKLPIHFRSPAVSGIVVDSKTGQPIPDVRVTVQWNAMRSTANSHDPETMCLHSEIVTTDTNGVFKAAAWGPETLDYGWFCFADDPQLTFSKSGKDLGDMVYNKNHPGFDEIQPSPFQTHTFELPSWNGKQIPR